MAKFTPRDIIAGLALVVCAVLLISGLDGEIKALMGVIVGYYFHSAENYLKAKKNNERELPPNNG